MQLLSNSMIRTIREECYSGRHEILRFYVKLGIGSVIQPPVQAQTKKMPEGVWPVSKNKVTNPKFIVDGYLPPCSSERKHRYEAVVYAVKVKEKTKGKLGYKKISKGRLIFTCY